MAIQKKSFNKIKAQVAKELLFIKGIFSSLSLPTPSNNDEDVADIDEMSHAPVNTEQKPQRAHSIAELEEKLAKIKDQQGFNIKKKLAKKSLTSKLNKKIKKERLKTGSNKGPKNNMIKEQMQETIKELKDVKEKKPVLKNKPVFNTGGKLVFSKFDFSSVSHKNENHKVEKDPKKVLEHLKQQELKVKELESRDAHKAQEVKEKMAWKNILQKAEGDKIKDDPLLLKKSIKKEEQKKKKSSKEWQQRVQKVVQKKQDRQVKRSENISKKKKEKKSKIIKAAVKRGRVVI